MSDENRTVDHEGCGADVAAYALGALDAEEVEAFRRHLESCAVCRDELAAFEGVVDALPMSVPPQPVPPGLRRRVMRAVETEPKPRAKQEPARRRRFRLGDWLVPRPALALGSALVVAACVIAGVALTSSSSPSTRVIDAQVTGQGAAQLRVRGDQGQLVVRRFSPPPAGQIYEVWLVKPDRPPAPTNALFSVTAQGDGDVEVPGSLRGVSKVMVTPEPAGGSLVPTHSPVIQASLT